jgi:CO/xanthine dehydrogenase Mo-binding subunit
MSWLTQFMSMVNADTTVIAEVGQRPGSGVARSRTESYHRPYLAHGSIGPSCAVALAARDRLEIWTHSQGVHMLRREIARALGITQDRLVVRHVDGAGCYGHNGADDAAMDAAMLALAVPARPVQVVWSRPDELSWSPLGPAGVVRISADCGPDGNVLSWRHEIWSGSFISRPGMTPNPAFLAASHRAGGEEIRSGGEPPQERGGGASRNAVPGYDFPAYEVVNHLLTTMPLRTSALRSLGAHLNVFSVESFMDELAADADRDPVEFGWRTYPIRAPAGCWNMLFVSRIGNRGHPPTRRAWNRICALQEFERLLRGRRRSRGRSGSSRATADHRRRRRTGHQSRRSGPSNRRWGNPGHQLDGEGAGSVRSVHGHQ